MKREFVVKRLHDTNDIDMAIKLAHDTFMIYEAPDYSAEGVQSFMSFLYGRELKNKILGGSVLFWGCYYKKNLVGMMAIRDGSHISLAFTHKDFLRQGIGRMLFNEIRDYVSEAGVKSEITLNSSPYGLPFYHAIGFVPTDMERIEDGIRFTPMKYKIVLED